MYKSRERQKNWAWPFHFQWWLWTSHITSHWASDTSLTNNKIYLEGVSRKGKHPTQLWYLLRFFQWEQLLCLGFYAGSDDLGKHILPALPGMGARNSRLIRHQRRKWAIMQAVSSYIGLSFVLQALLSLLCKHFLHLEAVVFICIQMNHLSLYLSGSQTRTKAWENINKKG